MLRINETFISFL